MLNRENKSLAIISFTMERDYASEAKESSRAERRWGTRRKELMTNYEFSD